MKPAATPFVFLAIDVLHALGIRRIDLHPRWRASLRFSENDQGDASLPVFGRIEYHRARIILLSELGTAQGLFTLCHEGGHWLTYLEHGEKLAARRGRFASYRYREWLANRHGWSLMKVIGADRFVTWRAWIAWNYNH